MKKINVGNGTMSVSEISLGCMRINRLSQNEAEALIKTSMEEGVNFFDHADIYGKSEADAFFAQAINMNDNIREKMVIQTKCAIRPGICFDFSKKHILESVDGSLKRLRTDYIDVLLLHRPDALMEPQEVAEAFRELKAKGKVKHFGVSNQNPYQIELLNKYLDEKILFNQLQLSITNCGMIDAGFNVNMSVDAGINRDGSILDYCRLNDITIQPWSPFQYGFGAGVSIGSEKYPLLNETLDRIGEKYNVTSTAIAVAWLLRHPAKMQPIVGTMNKARLQEICKASGITITREEWYEIYKASGKQLP